MPRRDPLTLDLDNDGLETVATSSTKPILFDHDGDGLKTSTGWVGPDDGFLVMDRDGNGVIDNGAELFGDATALYAGGLAVDGFAALAQEDSNVDGKVDVEDARWSQLKVWRDLNQDGISQTGELLTMDQAGIATLGVAKTANSQTLANGNQIADLGSFVRTSGTSDVSEMADINLAEDTFYRQFGDKVALADGVAALPELRGSGAVRDLREAASLSPDLQALLTQFAQATTRPQQRALLGQLLEAWADTSGLAGTMGERAGGQYVVSFHAIGSQTRTSSASADWSSTVDVWEKRLHVLEAFNGRYFFRLPNEAGAGNLAAQGLTLAPATENGPGGGAPQINVELSQAQTGLLIRSYEALFQSVYLALAMQTRFRPVLDEIGLVFNEAGVSLDFTLVERYFHDAVEADAVNGLADLIDFNRGLKGMAAVKGWDGAAMIAQYIATLPLTADLLAMYAQTGVRVVGQGGADGDGSAGEDIILADATGGAIYGNGGDDVLVGREGADALNAGAGDDTLFGGAGIDRLSGDAGNDMLEGGTGDDILWGGTGNDIYVVAKGDGMDTIHDYDTTAGNTDVVDFTDVASTEVTLLERKGDHLVLNYGESDLLTLQDYFYTGSASYKVEQLHFSDGVSWDEGAVKARVTTNGSMSNDYITGYADGSNRIYGFDGADYLTGGALADRIDGGDGNDTLYGQAGDDMLYGGAGKDELNGEAGADLLIGGMGDDMLWGGTGNDTYVVARGDGMDTISDYDTTAGNTDVVDFTDVASTEVTSLERKGDHLVLKYGESDQLTVKDYFYRGSASYKVEQLRFSDGVSWDDVAVKARVTTNGSMSNDYITGYGDGSNRIYGFDGADYLTGGALADRIDGGDGNDTLYGQAGDDMLYGGAGKDELNGEAGADLLIGAMGDDMLWGGTGNDTYVVARGDGMDTISDYDTTAGNTDVVDFTDVASTEVTSLERKGDHLVLKYGESDQLTLKNYFNTGSAAYKVEQLSFSDGVSWDEAAVKARVTTNGSMSNDYITGYADGSNRIYGFDGADYLMGGALADRIEGGDGNDKLYGQTGDDALYGGAGKDELNGEADADLLDGGMGDDMLLGGTGNDLYVIAKGDGVDTISDYDRTAGNTDVVQFTDVASNEVTSLTREGDHLVLKYGESDQLTVKDYFYTGSTSYKVEQLRFSDGVSWDEAAVKARVTTNGSMSNDYITGYVDGSNRIYGFDGADYLTGGALADRIEGGDGNDKLYGRAGDDALYGGAGKDELIGEAGADLLVGGVGDDMLLGGAGNDTYVIARGDGVDTISDYDTTAGNTDVVEFTDVASTAVTSLERKGDHLVLKYGESDQLTLQDYFYTGSASYRVEQLRFSDGVSWDDAVVKARVMTNGSMSNDYITGYADGSNRIYGLAGHDALNGGSGNDVIDGGDGNDTLYGNAGDDLLDGGAGDDLIYGGDGADTIRFGKGYGADAFRSTNSAAFQVDTVDLFDIAATEVDYVRLNNDLEIRVRGANDRLTLGDYFSAAGSATTVRQLRFADGVTMDSAAVRSLVVLAGDSGANIISGFSDGPNRIHGLGGNDSLRGGSGNDVLVGGDGDDTLSGGAGNALLIGGTGDDFIATGSGYDIIAFNKGDGRDTVVAGAGKDNTLSLGGGISAIDLLFSRSANDLVLATGESEKITFRDWYAGAGNKSVANLQIVAEGGPGDSAGTTRPRVAQFDFNGLASRFDEARTADPTISRWALTSSMMAFHLGSSDTAALGGELAYQYGSQGNVAGLSASLGQSQLGSAQFGMGSQALNPGAALQDAALRPI